MRAVKPLLRFVVVACAASSPSWAQDPAANSSTEAPPTTTQNSATASQPPNGKKLAWAQAVALGVERNQALLTERFLRRRAALSTREVWAAWSPSLIVDARYAHSDFATNNGSSVSVVDDRVGYSVGVSWQSVIGTTASATVGVDHGLTGATTEPDVSLQIEQPLLRGAFIDGAGLSLTEATLSRAVQSELFRDELNSFVVDVDSAYWDLALAENDLAIKTRSRERAQQQFDDTQENIRRGILAEGEIYVVEESLVIFDAEKKRATLRLLQAQRALARLLYLDNDAGLASVEGLDDVDAAVPDRKATIADALAHNPQLLAQRRRVDLEDARVRHAFNQTLPTLALRTTVGLQGSGAGYSDGFKDLTSTPGINGEIGVRLAVPLDRNSIDAGLVSAEVEARRARAELERQENALRFDVDNALAALSNDIALAASAHRQRELADKKLQAQMEKYKSGLSTLQDVVRFQRDLDDALIAEKRVVRSVRVGRTQLLAKTGALHEKVGVGVESDEEDRVVDAATGSR